MDRVAEALRRDALACPAGRLLGSETELLERYSVSRPTLRQAAALVAQEHLLEIRRGYGGGYFARRPDTKAAARVAALYLRSHDADVGAVIRMMAPIRIELAKLASKNATDEQKERLRQFLASECEKEDQDVSYLDFLRSEREFGRILSEMSGNPVAALFLEILYGYSAMISPEEDIFRNRPDRRSRYRKMRRRLGEVLLWGDEEMTVVAAKRCALDSTEWMMSDLEQQPAQEQARLTDSENRAGPAMTAALRSSRSASDKHPEESPTLLASPTDGEVPPVKKRVFRSGARHG